MTATVLLVRHGRTALNKEGRLRGLADPPLDAVGDEQARAVASELSSRPVFKVVCSPLQRARRTAEVIADAARCEVVTDDRFNDRDYGHWTGVLRSEVERQWGSIDDAPGVQPTQAVLDRAVAALDEWADVIDRHLPMVLVCVTHDAVIRPILHFIDPSMGAAAVNEGSFQVLERIGALWRIVAVDQTPPIR